MIQHQHVMCSVSHLAKDESGLNLAHFRSVGDIMLPLTNALATEKFLFLLDLTSLIF